MKEENWQFRFFFSFLEFLSFFQKIKQRNSLGKRCQILSVNIKISVHEILIFTYLNRHTPFSSSFMVVPYLKQLAYLFKQKVHYAMPVLHI